jgi:hypothetical protein
VCDLGDRFAVLDTATNKVSVFDLQGELLTSTDFNSSGVAFHIRDAGQSGWLVKGYSTAAKWTIWHIDSSGALVKSFVDPAIGEGSYYSTLNNGTFVVNDRNMGKITLFNLLLAPILSLNTWNDPNGWLYSYVLMGDVAGLIGGRLVVLPEQGSRYYGGVGRTPYIYFYNNTLTLSNKVNISSLNITIFALAGLSNGGFVGIGNTTGGEYLTHLFYFNSSGAMVDQRDITDDIPSITTKNFMHFTISSTNDGGVIVAELHGSSVWIYHSPPVEINLFTQGITNIGGIGGSAFQAQVVPPSTLIELSSFTADGFNRKVLIAWSTASEIDNSGFNILRAESQSGPFSKINDSLISAQGSPTMGASYEFVDEDVKNRKTYYYKLEDIDLNGQSTMHGPVSATPRLVYGLFNQNFSEWVKRLKGHTVNW